MSECPECGATDEPEKGIVVGVLSGARVMCTVCRANELSETTVLSRRESDIAAHKQITGASHEVISDRLHLSASTVDEYSRRFKDKVRRSERTTAELSEFVN